MTGGALSKRYARALVEVAAGPQAPGGPAGEAAARDLEATGRELDAFAQLLREHRDVRAFFANPGVQRRDKEGLLDRLASALGLGTLVTTFLRVLLEKGRLISLETIARTYRDLTDDRLGRVRAEVVAAAPLDEAARARLAQRLAALTGRQVLLETKTDPSLLGGLVARVRDTVYDGSLRAQLARLREQLARG